MVRDFPADGDGRAVAGKMYTFVSGKRVIDSRHYAEFMSTFVYLLEKGVLAKSRT